MIILIIIIITRTTLKKKHGWAVWGQGLYAGVQNEYGVIFEQHYLYMY